MRWTEQEQARAALIRNTAVALGVTEKTVRNWLTGRTTPSPLAVQRLSELGLLPEGWSQ